MTPITIHPIWLVLIIVAGTTCFSLIILSFGLYITSWRQKREDSKKYKETDKKPRYGQQVFPDIMGHTHKIVRQTTPIDASKSQKDTPAYKQATFANEIPSKELDDVFGNKDDNREDPETDFDPEEEEIDLQDEELELQVHRASGDNDFAAGTTFEELIRTSVLLQRDNLEPAEQKTVLDMAARLFRTDLWDMITQAIPQANEKIAKMLDTPFRTEADSRPDDWESFDIRDFI
ncbi:hypothetical protein [Proteiniphilum sp. UBA5346]|uniref:hypothetical protein n=1 Tax=Proteiniphilum sp. UBA5346 TaxID=1947277 RepID=UPI00257C1F4E|nr:hypothetical protein [Proteiniphilum sp. UBA5346]